MGVSLIGDSGTHIAPRGLSFDRAKSLSVNYGKNQQESWPFALRLSLLRKQCARRRFYGINTLCRPLGCDLIGIMIDDIEQLSRKLEELRVEHRDLDEVIARLIERPDGGADLLQIQRLKKRKLVLKDQIHQLESALLPDIIA